MLSWGYKATTTQQAVSRFGAEQAVAGLSDGKQFISIGHPQA
jgi:hypothetical protein